jgi:hypothetical protein
MRKIIFILFTTAWMLSCSDDTPANRDTFDYFQQNLKADIAYAQITSIFGEPDDDIGSVIHIYVYELEDNTKIMIGYTDHIHWATHVDKNNQVLDVII